MARPMPIELRERIVKARQEGEELENLAERFLVSYSSVRRFLARAARGILAPSPRGGGMPRRVDAAGEAVLRDLVRANPDFTETEFSSAFTQKTGRTVSRSSIGRALARLGITRKKSHSKPQRRPQSGSRTGRGSSSSS